MSVYVRVGLKYRTCTRTENFFRTDDNNCEGNRAHIYEKHKDIFLKIKAIIILDARLYGPK